MDDAVVVLARLNTAIMAHRVLLINPIPGDFDRASSIVRSYAAEYMAGDAIRRRYNCVIYAPEGEPRPAAVWHSRNQITIHFGDMPFAESAAKEAKDA